MPRQVLVPVRFVITLKAKTPAAWAAKALADFDSFLLDHASCERKASAVGMSMVAHYPDRTEMIEPMIQFAREELEHFHQVYRVIEKRGLQLTSDTKDEYVNLLLKHVRPESEDRFLDRLLISGIIEARGTERMGLVADALSEPALKNLYVRLTRAEDRHKDFFVRMALLYFSNDEVSSRLDELLDAESEIIEQLPPRNALH